MKVNYGLAGCVIGTLFPLCVAHANDDSVVKDTRGTVSIVYENDWVDGGKTGITQTVSDCLMSLEPNQPMDFPSGWLSI
jgi:hypothetical protein